MEAVDEMAVDEEVQLAVDVAVVGAVGGTAVEEEFVVDATAFRDDEAAEGAWSDDVGGDAAALADVDDGDWAVFECSLENAVDDGKEMAPGREDGCFLVAFRADHPWNWETVKTWGGKRDRRGPCRGSAAAVCERGVRKEHSLTDVRDVRTFDLTLGLSAPAVDEAKVAELLMTVRKTGGWRQLMMAPYSSYIFDAAIHSQFSSL